MRMDTNHSDSPSISKQGSIESLVSSQLTIHQYKNKLTNIIEKEPIFVLIGATGSGKTTQIPQWCLQSRHANDDNVSIKSRTIAITQPRRVAAVSIANRVAQEMKVLLGQKVGYSVRFDEVVSSETRIKFMTDGMLLRESLHDPMLKNYCYIILDEAHERSLQTDILFAIVKKAYLGRKRSASHPASQLRLIIMSATMNVDKFSDYFDQAPVYKIAGRQHPIEIFYANEDQPDFIHSCLVTVFQIHRNEPMGDILVFCTGQEEIDSMVSLTRQNCFQLPREQRNLVALPLYAALPFNIQYKIFKPFKGKRKVIFATNIAETSITIPGIKYVVDNGKYKCKSYKASLGMDTLKTETISKAQAWQRSGRAGRVTSGTCYRLYTKYTYDLMLEQTIPEVLRCNLSSVLLHLAALGIHNFDSFDFMDRPSIENIKKSAEILLSLGAIIRDEDEGFEITSLGKMMVEFPLDPCLSRILIASADMGCSEEILSIISLLSVENLFHIPSHKKEEANEVHKKFRSSEGDHIMLLKLFKAYKAVKGNKDWCKENYVDFRNMRLVNSIRQQMASLYTRSQFKRESCGQNTELIRKCLVVGMFHNIAIIGKDNEYRMKFTDKKVYIHPSSCLFNTKPECLIYSEIIKTSKSYMRNVSVIEHNWIKELKAKGVIARVNR